MATGKPVNRSNRETIFKPSDFLFKTTVTGQTRLVNRSNRSVYRSKPVTHVLLNLNLNLINFQSNRSDKLLPQGDGLTRPVGFHGVQHSIQRSSRLVSSGPLASGGRRAGWRGHAPRPTYQRNGCAPAYDEATRGCSPDGGTRGTRPVTLPSGRQAPTSWFLFLFFFWVLLTTGRDKGKKHASFIGSFLFATGRMGYLGELDQR